MTHCSVLIFVATTKRIFKISFYSEHGLRTHDGYIPNSLRPKFKSLSQINILDLDIKT